MTEMWRISAIPPLSKTVKLCTGEGGAPSPRQRVGGNRLLPGWIRLDFEL